MLIRQAHISDIPSLMQIRFAVKENVLNNPLLVTNEICAEYLEQRGKGWLAEADGNILGFAIVDLKEHSVWALFVHPDQEKKGIATALHSTMLNWYFSQATEDIWLTTAPATRAEKFYISKGWIITGQTSSGELKFEMTKERWAKTTA